MKYFTNSLLSILAITFIFSGCTKDVDEYNQPASYWYSKIISAVVNKDLEDADSYFSSLQSEHIGSEFLPEATLILAIAHMKENEYLLSEHFASEYIKRYANSNEKEFAEYMKIKAKYMALPNPRRDQVLIQEAIKEGEKFKRTYSYSMYYALVDSMLTNLRVSEAVLNESIADLYMRLDKPKSSAYYKNIKPQRWIDWEKVERSQTAWYRAWFEGDGTSSWYDFMIPDTQSVVSRNTVQDDESAVEEFVIAKEEASSVGEKLYDKYYKQNTFDNPEINKAVTKFKTSNQKYELKKAKALFKDGAITKSEYIELKKEILKH
ncbi:outer membrane protein assembly factor BamD [Sulfurimonas sp. SAG-AH-194-I05]|nr:outer membrane protein assembly factor BamD [Sulfurimonas sp. SAG-AH-194-I05]MDF1875890.1 outer membrane protein assembly factor BamD [Sulfurimonas sp. SAG-AH-194-I05]